MRQTAGLAVLLAVSAVAGAWWFRPTAGPHVVATSQSAACDDGSACTDLPPAGDAGVDSAETATAAQSNEDGLPADPPSTSPPDSGPTPPEPAPAPLTREDGIRLREEADRLLAEGRVHEGIDALRRAAEANPTPENYAHLGDLLGRLTVHDESARNLRRAAELDPGNADRWIALANAYYRAINPGEAWKAEKMARLAEPGLVLGRDAQGRRVRRSDSGSDKR